MTDEFQSNVITNTAYIDTMSSFVCMQILAGMAQHVSAAAVLQYFMHATNQVKHLLINFQMLDTNIFNARLARISECRIQFPVDVLEIGLVMPCGALNSGREDVMKIVILDLPESCFTKCLPSVMRRRTFYHYS